MKLTVIVFFLTVAGICLGQHHEQTSYNETLDFIEAVNSNCNAEIYTRSDMDNKFFGEKLSNTMRMAASMQADINDRIHAVEALGRLGVIEAIPIIVSNKMLEPVGTGEENITANPAVKALVAIGQPSVEVLLSRTSLATKWSKVDAAFTAIVLVGVQGPIESLKTAEALHRTETENPQKENVEALLYNLKIFANGIGRNMWEANKSAPRNN